ncbi:MAG: hypothetical protein KA243_02265 [Candidatus Aminicenantes bacterium]|nr:hypothetical protein [Candidatus Aminicenantes bacterium]
MKIIKNILRKLNPVLCPAGAKIMPQEGREGAKKPVLEAEDCRNCYTAQHECEVCNTCEKGFSSECSVCYSCEKCFTEQA